MKTKERLDVILVERGLAITRQKAQGIILAGMVSVRGKVATKAGERFGDDVEIAVKQSDRFVSRGGEKLDPVIDIFQVNVSGRIALDVGASTGGFTDCLLQRGVSRVYAIDVGHNQIAHKLRCDERVVLVEGINARYLQELSFDVAPDLVVIDVSFIGLAKVLPEVLSVVARPCQIIALVKPQFEVGPELVSKGGVVKSEELREKTVDDIIAFAEGSLGLRCAGRTPSPVKGLKRGNQEYFVLLEG